MASASTFARVPDLAELAERSSAVVQGQVAAATVREAPYGLATRYEVAVERTLAGEAGDAVVVELPGGRREDGLVQTFSGVPVLRPGDEVVVFVPRAGERASIAGVLPVRGDGVVVDPLARADGPRSVPELLGKLSGLGGEGESEPPVVRYFEASGTSDP